MSGYSVIRNGDIDAGSECKDWGSLSWFASKSLSGLAGLTAGRVVIRKGKSNPRHAHPNCSEVLYLLSGELDHTADDETIKLKPGDALLIPPGVLHNALSAGDVDAEMIVMYDSGERGFVAEKK